MKNKIFFIMLFTFVTVFVACVSGCNQNKLPGDTKAERDLKSISKDCNYIIQQGYVFIQGENVIDFSKIAKDYLNSKKDDSENFYYSFEEYLYSVTDKYVCFAISFISSVAGKNATLFIRANVKNPFDYKIFDVNGYYHTILFVTDECFLYNRSGIIATSWQNYITSKVISDRKKIADLEQKYKEYQEKQNNEIGTEEQYFEYGGKTYVWENKWVKSQETYNCRLVVADLQKGTQYTFDYSDFQNVCPKVYKVYKNLPFAQVFVQNGELFVVCARYGRDNGDCSNKLVFRYNNQTKTLEYVGFGTENHIHVFNVFGN